MPIYNWRSDSCPRAAERCFDANGVDVEGRCWYVDTDTGEVRRDTLDEDGDFIVENGQLRTETVMYAPPITIIWRK